MELLEWRLDKVCDKREKIGPAKLSHSRTYIRSLLPLYLWNEFFPKVCWVSYFFYPKQNGGVSALYSVDEYNWYTN